VLHGGLVLTLAHSCSCQAVRGALGGARAALPQLLLADSSEACGGQCDNSEGEGRRGKLSLSSAQRMAAWAAGTGLTLLVLDHLLQAPSGLG
jgi:hypothetical protein